MKRIAILSYNHDKYSETFIHNLVKYLPFEVHYLYGGALPLYYGDHQKIFNEDGLRKIVIALKELAGSTKYEQHQQALEKYLVQHKIEAVHANYAITAFPVMDICARNGIPLIVHFRGWTAYRSTIIEMHREDYDKLFAIARAVVCVSSDMKQQLIQLGCAENKITIIPSGANTDIFTYSDHSNNEAIFLAAGRFCDTKNPHLTILAFSKVLAELPNARLVMVGGEENLLSACVGLCKSLKIEDRVEFKGVPSQAELFKEMQGAYAFVQHSATTVLDEKEGTPNSIMEAGACGLPVVATRHAGIKDVVIENETGLLVDEFDVDAMAANMIRIVKDKPLAKQMGINAAKRISEHFTTKMYIEKLSAVILSATNK